MSRWIFRLAVGVLCVGTLVFLVAVFRDPQPEGPLPPAPRFDNPAAKKPAKLDPAARKVAGEFVLTAVARKNLAASWPLIHPELRQGYTKKEWLKGDIPVTPFPVSKVEQARFRVAETYPNEVVLEVALIPNKGAKGVEALTFWLGMKKVGVPAHKHWEVYYWMPRYSPPVPKTPN